MDLADFLGERLVFSFSFGRNSFFPRIVAAGGDSQHTAHRGDRIVGLMRFHERVDFGGTPSVS
jgi:hypothetical protein